MPKPVLVTPLQVTVLPDVTQAAAAGPAMAVASKNADDAAMVNGRADLPLMEIVSSTTFIREVAR